MNICDKYISGPLLSLAVILKECLAYSDPVEKQTKHCYLVIFVLSILNHGF